MFKNVYLKTLKPHPKSLEIFGNPKESQHYGEIRNSVARHGLFEKLVINADNVVLKGTLRRECLLDLYGPDYLVAVEERHFGSAQEELTFVIESNVRRRPWSKSQLAAALKALVEASPDQGGTKQPQGRPPKGSARGTLSGALKTDAEAAKLLGIGKHQARDLLTIYGTDGVPQQLKMAVDAGEISPTRAARAVKTALRVQGGVLHDPDVVQPVLDAPQATTEASPAPWNREQLLDEVMRLTASIHDVAAVEAAPTVAAQLRADFTQLLVSIVSIVLDSLTGAGVGAYAPTIRRSKRGWLIEDCPGARSLSTTVRCK